MANGLIGHIVSEPDMIYNNRSFFIDFLPDILATPFQNLECDYEYFSAPAKVRTHYNNPFNQGERFEYGYCITTHLSQGSEASRGIYIDEWMGRSLDDIKRLQYTGVTRFKDALIFVKKHRKIW